jgi:E3 ubiquitin-protein ligase Mdm2
VICMELPRNAMIVHEDTGHFCCCLACALREQQRGQPCPICRQPIEKVIRSFAS